MKIVWWSAAALYAGVALVLLSSTGERATMQQSAQRTPTIRLTLGDDFQTIQRESTYRFPPRELGRIDVVAVSEPVTLEYTRPGCAFTLPPARSFSAAIDDGHAVSVTVSPHLRFISFADAESLIDQVKQLLVTSGWTLARQYLSAEQVRGRFRDSQQSGILTLRTEDWRCLEDEVSIELARHWRQGESLPQAGGRNEDLYVVSVKIENDRVRTQYPGR
jgi:hypothetical protein